MDQIHRRGRGGKRLQRKPKSKSGVRLAALLLCLAMLAGFLPTLAAAVDGGEKLSSIVEFQSITLRYAGTGGQAVGAQVPENALLESGEPLRLCYTYEITQEQCKLIKADTPYYLEVSPHLSLPDMQDGSPLILTDDDKKVPFGTIYADGSRAWVAFLAKEGGTDTVLSDYGELRNADFYLDCERAAEVPEGEDPIDGTSNLYVMKFENSEKFSLPFGYAEREPMAARAKIEKDGALEGRTITWTIKYTPWQNPAGADGVDLDTPFELRDTIDTSLHRYVEGSVKIDGRPAAVYATREAIQRTRMRMCWRRRPAAAQS